MAGVAGGREVVVFGASQLIADLVGGMVGDLELDGDGRPVAVLVDPVTAHWDAARDKAIVVVLTDPTNASVVAAVRRGADAVVTASAVIADLPLAVATVRSGGTLLASEHTRAVVEALRGEPDGARLTLTRRETDIVRSILAGDVVKQTAIRLGIAPKTVENLQRRLFRKLDVRNRAQAVARVHELGLLGDGDGDDVDGDHGDHVDGDHRDHGDPGEHDDRAGGPTGGGGVNSEE